MSGISITSGTFQITSDLAPFGFADVSKSIMIQGSGPGSGTLVSTIIEVFDSGSASIANNAFVTVTDSPSMFGVDFRPVIQGMLNLAASNTESLTARTVQIPAGTFLIDTHNPTASLFFQDDVILQGAGIGATKLVAFGGNSGILIRNSESINRDFSIRDMTLDGAKDFQTGSEGSILVQLNGAENFDLSNLAIVSASGDAISITGSSDGTFRNVRQKANDRSDFVATASARLSFVDVNTTGSLGYGMELVATVSTSMANVNLSPEGSGTLFERQSSAATSFVNFGAAEFRTNDFVVFGTSVFATPVDQLGEFFIKTVPFKSKGQAHAFQTISGSRTWLQFPLIVNNAITGSDLQIGANPGMALVMDYVNGETGVGGDDQFMSIMSVGKAGPEFQRISPDKNWGWTAFYTCSLLSGSQFWSGSAFEFKGAEISGTILTASHADSIDSVVAEKVLPGTFAGNFTGSGDWNIGGDFVVDGRITAEEFHTEVVSSSIIHRSGSTKFGDTADDVHSFTGSLGVALGEITASEFSGTHEPFTTAMKFFNGESIETVDTQIISDGTSVSCSIQKDGGGDIQFFFTGTLHPFDTTPPAQVALTLGTDTVPQENYVFVTGSGGTFVLTSNITGWPDGPHAAVATVVVQSAAGVQTDGPYKLHVWTNHIDYENENGHQSHVNKKLRLTADWESGIALAVSSSITEAETWLDTTTGKVFQLHNFDVRALDMAAGDPIFVFNDPTTPYSRITGLSELTQDAEGIPLVNNRYYNFVIWGSVGEDDSNTQFFLNLPDGNYNNEPTAQMDTAATAIFTIPGAFRGTGFLIARVTLQYSTTGVPFNGAFITDLRGLSPSAAPGGGASVSDHGALSGLLDDDHPQYLHTSGTRPLAGNWNAGAAITSSFTGSFVGSGEGITGVILADSATFALGITGSDVVGAVELSNTASYIAGANVDGAVAALDGEATGTFTGSLVGAVTLIENQTIPDGIQVHHALHDLGVQSSSFTASWNDGNVQRFQAGGDVTISMDNTNIAGIYAMAVDNSGGHNIRFESGSIGIFWHGGIVPRPSTGSDVYGFMQFDNMMLGYPIAQDVDTGGGEFNFEGIFTGSFSGPLIGSVQIPSGSRSYHVLVDRGIHSSSVNVDWSNNNFSKVTPGANIDIGLASGLVPGQICYLEIDNAGSHSITLTPAGLMWQDGGVAQTVSTGSNFIVVTQLSTGTYVRFEGRDIS